MGEWVDGKISWEPGLGLVPFAWIRKGDPIQISVRVDMFISSLNGDCQLLRPGAVLYHIIAHLDPLCVYSGADGRSRPAKPECGPQGAHHDEGFALRGHSFRAYY